MWASPHPSHARAPSLAATERAVERACVACRSARFRRLFPEYCEEHARRVAARSQARGAALRGLSGSQRCAVSEHYCAAGRLTYCPGYWVRLMSGAGWLVECWLHRILCGLGIQAAHRA